MIFGAKNWKKESKYLQKMMAKYPLPLPDDTDPLPLCVLDLHLRDWLEKHICKQEGRYRQLMQVAIDASLKMKGYKLIDHPFKIDDMPTYLKPADINGSSEPIVKIKQNWIGE